MATRAVRERTRAADVLAWLREREGAMVDLLVALARAESPSDDADSQEGVQALLRRELERAGCVVRRIPGRHSGGHLYARPQVRRAGLPLQLLVGHADTVWPVGTVRDMPVEVGEGVVRGPGTFDMKAGLVQMAFALRCLRELALDPPALPVAFVNSDEEIGSPESRRWVERLARRAARAFVLEPAMGPGGALKTARKGVSAFTVIVRGRAAHAGLDPERGVSAILELARVVEHLHALTDPERGATVNVGVVAGGTRANVVAAEARAEVDVRTRTLADAQALEAEIRRIRPSLPGSSIEVRGGLRVPPLERTERNRRLWAAARAAGERLGLDLAEGLAGGGSDGSITSRSTATLDGLGPVGGGAHARDEHVIASSLPERAALLVELLLEPVAG